MTRHTAVSTDVVAPARRSRSWRARGRQLVVLALVAAWLPLLGAGTAAHATPTPDTWAGVANMPTARSNLAAATGTNGKIYAMGGTGNTATVEAYDPVADSWATVASMPTGRADLAAVAGPDGKIYAIGGVNGGGTLTTVEAYDPVANSWTTKASMPTPRSLLGAATGPDGKIYAIGGFNSGDLATVESYDPATDTWTTKASMPTAARSALAVATGDDGRIYAIGGSGFLSTVQAYDTGTNTWTTVASMPTGRNRLTAAAGPDGRIYAIGGQCCPSPFPAYLSTVEAYDPGTDTWTTAASMSTVRDYLAAATAPDGRVYAIGGVNTSGVLDTVEAYTTAAGTWVSRASMGQSRDGLAAATDQEGGIYAIGGEYLDTVERYDPGANSWTTKANMPTGRLGLAAATGSDGTIYAVGGQKSSSPFWTAALEAYDPGTDGWTTLAPMLTARDFLGAATGPDGKVYAIGGRTSGGTAPSVATVQAYDPGSNSWTTKASMHTARNGMGVAVGQDGRIYAIGGYLDNAFTKPTDNVEVYDPGADTWTALPPMATARGLLAAATGVDGRIYAIGGFTGNGFSGSDTNTVEAYDPATGSWTTVASMSCCRGALAAAAGGDGRVYAIGGVDPGVGGILASAEAYTPSLTRTGTVLAASPNPAGAGQDVTLTATVFPLAPPAGTPTGTVHFFDGPTDLGAFALSGAPARAEAPLAHPAAGTHNYHAVYEGTLPFASSTSPTVSVEVRTPTAMAATAGSPQHATVGNAFATAPQVMVTDSSSNPVPGQQVTFTAPASGASGTFVNGTVADTETTDAAGLATATTFTANTTAGAYSVVASLSGLPPATVALVNDAGPATSLSLTGFPTPITAGTPGSFTAKALDTYGNIDTAYGGTLHFTSTDPAASLPADSTLIAGTKTFGATLRTVGTHQLDATDNGTLSASQTGIVVNPGPATHLVVSGYPSPTTAGVSHTFTVTAQDASNNIATGYIGTVHLTSSDGQALLGANHTLTNGVRTFSATLKAAGLQSITATDTVTPGITGSQSATVDPAAVSSLVVSGYPSSTTAGAPHTVTVRARDAYNNTATAYGGTLHFTSTDPAAVLPADSTLTAGTGTFAVTLNTAGTRSLTAGDGTRSASQTGIVVNPAAATHLVVTGYPNPTTAGAGHTFTVTAKDGSNNTDPTYAGTVQITSSDGQAVPPANATLTNGTKSFSVTLKTAGTQFLTATDTVTPAITGSQTGIVVNPGATIHLVVAGHPSPTTAGAPHTFAVTAKDLYNNTITGYASTVHFTSNDPAAQLPADTTLTAGTGTFAATLKTTGTRSLTAGDGTRSASQTGIVVNPAAPHHLVVGGYPNPTTAGAHTLTVTAKDQFNNTTPSYAGTVHFTSSDPQAVLPADATLTNGTKSFSATLKTVGTQYLTAADTVTPSITGTQGPITLNPGALSKFAVSGYPSSTVAGTAHTFTVRALDAYNNTVTGYAGTVHFTSTDAQAALPANATLVNGVKTFSATLKTAGTRSITAADSVTPSKKGTQGSITVTPAALSKLVVSGYPSSTVAGTAHTFTVRATDAYANTITGYGGTVHFTSNDPAAVLPANSTLTNGTKNFSATLNTPGTRSITATDTVTATVKGTQGSITVT